MRARITRAAFVVALLATSVVTAGPASGSASAAAATATGFGVLAQPRDETLSLETWDALLHVTTTGTASKIPHVLATSTCILQGTGSGSIAVAVAGGTWSCNSGPLAGKGGCIRYTQVGLMASLQLLYCNSATVGPPTTVTVGPQAGSFLCGFSPNSLTPPWSAFTLGCMGGYADVG